jgi:hypothetical protein
MPAKIGMGAAMSDLRLRQLVFASHDREDIERFQEVFGLGAPFIDPGVGAFGLENGVFALGDQFVEIVVPRTGGTAAGRFLERQADQGGGGYMVIVQTPDVVAVRRRADEAGIRRVWNIDLPEISASHLHPVDIGAAIVSVDTPRPPKSWLWGGAGWEDRAVAGGIAGATLTAPDPAALARRWADILDAPLSPEGPAWRLALAEGTVMVEPGAREAVSTFHFQVANPAAIKRRAAAHGWTRPDGALRILGVDVELLPL